MPNFFQAIGQSNLQDTMRNLTNTALNIRQMQNQEQHMRAIEAYQDQAFELQRQNTEAERLKAQEYKRQQELIDIDNELGRMGFTSPEIAYFKKKAGLHVENVGGRDYIQRGVGTKLFMDAAKDPQSNIEVGTIRIGNLDKQIAQLETAMAGGEEHGIGGSGNNSNTQGNKPAMKLKPEQVQQLGVQLQQLREQRTQLVNNMKIEQRKLDAQLKEKRYLPNSPNGMFDTETQQVVAGTRKPEEKKSIPQAKASGSGTGRGGPGGGGGKPTKAFSTTYVATLPDGQEINAQKFQNGVFADMQGNPLPAGSRVISTVGSKSLKRRLGGGQPSNATQSSSPASQSQPLWKKYQ